MQKQCVLTVSSPDKPGVVEKISQAVNSVDGSWLESKLAHLCGKFVGVVCISIAEKNIDDLRTKISELNKAGIHILCEELLPANAPKEALIAEFTAVGPDRTGIIKEISSAFAQQGINVEQLETTLSSMPYSGDPMFNASGRLSLPQSLDMKDLYERLDNIANNLGLDLDVNPINA